MEVQQLQAIQHVCGFELIDHGDQFRNAEAKLGSVARAIAPASGALGRELGSNPEHRSNAEALGGCDRNIYFLFLL